MMTEPFGFLLGALAAFRLTRLLITDQIFSRLRETIWSKFPPTDSKFGYLFTCMWCMSVWTASLLLLSSIIMPTVTLYLCIVLAISAISGLIAAYEDRN